MVGSSGEKMMVNSGKWCLCLFNAQYVKNEFTSSAVVCVATYRRQLTVSGVGDVTGQSRKLI